MGAWVYGSFEAAQKAQKAAFKALTDALVEQGRSVDGDGNLIAINAATGLDEPDGVKTTHWSPIFPTPDGKGYWIDAPSPDHPKLAHFNLDADTFVAVQVEVEIELKVIPLAFTNAALEHMAKLAMQ